MLRYLPFLLILALTIYAFIDCLNTPEEEVKHLPKVVWVIIILLFSIVGPVVWLFAGKKGRGRRRPGAPGPVGRARRQPGVPEVPARRAGEGQGHGHGQGHGLAARTSRSPARGGYALERDA